MSGLWPFTGGKALAASATPRAIPAGHVTLGSTSKEVEAILGAPRKVDQHPAIHRQVWRYGDFASLTFHRGRLIEWSSAGMLPVSLGERDPHASPVSIGSKLDEVVAVLGTPPKLSRRKERDTFEYGMGEVVAFKDGRLVASSVRALELRDPAIQPDSPPVRVGSTMDDVKASLGAPHKETVYSALRQTVWTYGHSSITFDKKGVVCKLKDYRHLRSEQSAPKHIRNPLTLGSTRPIVRKAQTHAVWKEVDERRERYTDGVRVTYDEQDRVTAWRRPEGLRGSQFGTKVDGAPPFEHGSTKQQVLDAQGPPTGARRIGPEHHGWAYGRSTVLFRNGLVVDWHNRGELSARGPALGAVKSYASPDWVES